jgi:putative restriction endonuclease
VVCEATPAPIATTETAWSSLSRSTRIGIKNGVASLQDLVAAITQYRKGEVVTPATFIVCRVLVEPVFLPELLWFPVRENWSGSIMKGKTFGGDTMEGQRLWTSLEESAAAVGAPPMGEFGEPVLVRPRLGQGAFRVAITELYRRQCALTQGKVLPALDAAHIRPYADGGVHAKSNGILLRKDIHSVFDAGYATINPDYRFVVSDKVREVFNNGEEYRRLHGGRLWFPPNPADRPDPEALRWHNRNRFLG